MKKFRQYILAWLDGKKVRGISVMPADIQECVYIYNSLAHREKPSFINGTLKSILDICGIRSVEEGIGRGIV